MKKFYITFCLLFLSVIAFSQWVKQTSGTTEILYTVYFIDEDTILIGGEGNTLLRTTNKGINWTNTVITPNVIKSITFTDAHTGFAVGGGPNGGFILKTTNCGINWISTNTTPFLWSVDFPVADTGYAVGGVYPQTGYLLKTCDGGYSWGVLLSNISNWLTDVFFFDKNTGFMIGGSGIIMKTTNGGINWAYSQGIPNKTLTSIYFTDSNTGYITGYEGLILKTTNAGNNWYSLYSGTGFYLESVHFVNNNTGFAVGANGNILKTTNAGENWFFQYSGTSNYLHSSCFVNDTIGYTIGNNGTILKTTNGGVGFIDNNRIFESVIKIFPNPSSGKIIISTKGNTTGKMMVSIINILGEQVYFNYFYNQNSLEIDISSLTKGIYLVKVQTDHGNGVKKLVLE